MSEDSTKKRKKKKKKFIGKQNSEKSIIKVKCGYGFPPIEEKFDILQLLIVIFYFKSNNL